MQTYIATTILAAIAIVGGIVSVSTIILSQSIQAQGPSGAPFEINSAISEDRIVITIVRSTAEQELPEGPIVIIPPNETAGEDNATVILPPESNETGTAPPGNITIIEPDGEITQLPAGNITETPGNVTVIDPPACGCPPVGETEAEPGVPTQLPVMPPEEPLAAAGNETATQLPADQLEQETENQEVESNDDGGNGNGDGNDGGG